MLVSQDFTGFTDPGKEKVFDQNLPIKERLCIAVTQAWQRPFYKNYWKTDELGDVLNLIRQGQFYKLPVFRKQHLREHFDQLVSYDDAVDVVSSSGTTGRPVDMPIHFQQERGRICRVRRLYRYLGVKEGSKVLQLLSLNDLFTLGVLSWQAIKAEGAIAIRCSPARLNRILDAIVYNRPEFVVGNPYVMVKLAEAAGDRWPDLKDLPNKAFFAVAATFDPLLNLTPVARKVIDMWGIKEHLNQYGTSEVGPVAFGNVEMGGMWLHCDYNYVELVDSETGIPVEDGQPGEVVVTGLTSPRGFLPVRYATGDVAAWMKTIETPEGRKRAMGPIIGRTDHQLKILGQTVFPDLLLNVCDQQEGVKRSAIGVRKDPIAGDVVTLLCVPKEGADSEMVKVQVKEQCDRRLAVSPEVKMVSNDYLENLQTEAMKKTNGSKVPRFFQMN